MPSDPRSLSTRLVAAALAVAMLASPTGAFAQNGELPPGAPVPAPTPAPPAPVPAAEPVTAPEPAPAAPAEPVAPVQLTKDDHPADPGRDPRLIAPAAEPEDHRVLTMSLIGGVYLALYGYTYLAWYRRGEDSSELHFHDEGWFGVTTYSGGADKLGHMWANYVLTFGSASILQWGGWSKTVSLLTSAGLASSFFILVEIKDGYKPQYGFSWGDVLFNTAGQALGVVMSLFPEVDERFDFRFDYFPSEPYRRDFENDGINSAEDYTGQRMLLAYHLSSIDTLQESKATSWLRFIDVVAGYRAAHYKPDKLDSNDHRQEVYLGLTLNVQAVIDEFLVPETGLRDATAGTRFLRSFFEFVQIPYTTVRVNVLERSTPDLCDETSCPSPAP